MSPPRASDQAVRTRRPAHSLRASPKKSSPRRPNVLHTIVDKLGLRNPLPSAHGHAQAGRAERSAAPAKKGPDPGAVRGPIGIQPAVHQQPGAGPAKPDDRDAL